MIKIRKGNEWDHRLCKTLLADVQEGGDPPDL